MGIKKRKNDINFDLLVEQKKSIMRGKPSAQGHQRPEKKTSRSSFEHRVSEIFNELSQKKEKSDADRAQLEEIKLLMAIFDKLAWGPTDELKPLHKEIKKHLPISVSLNSTHRSFKHALQKNIFQKISFKGPVKISMLAKSLCPLALCLELSSHPHKAYELTGLKNSHNKDDVKLSFQTIYNENVKSIKNAMSFEELSFELAGALDLPTLTKELTKALLLTFHQKPLQKVKTKEEAMESFDLEGQPTVERIKKRYKELVKVRHPDKLSGYGFPAAVQQQITENFAIIQSAYDILLETTK